MSAREDVPADSVFPESAGGAAWDAGELGCGELVLALCERVRALGPGEVLLVTARDAGAAADIPAWCALTGHTLVRAAPPRFWIRRREG